MDEPAEKIVGVFTTDGQMNIQLWDPALERMTGLSAKTVVGRPLLEIVPDLSSRGLLERFQRSLREGTTEILAPALHHRLIPCPPSLPSKHYSEMQQQVKIVSMTGTGGGPGLTVTVEDVTDRMERKMDVIKRLNDPNPSVRLDVAREISSETEPILPEMMGPIIERLGDRDWRVRRRLTQALTRRAAPDAIHTLLTALKEKHLDFGTVNSVLQILKATDVNTTGTLIDFLRSDDPDLRIQAALALGELPGALAAQALIAAVDDPETNVRYQAIESLGKIRAAESVDVLLRIAEQRDFFLTFAALEALGHVGDHTIVPRLEPFLDDGIFWEPAARSIARIGSADAAPSLARLLNNNDLPVVAAAEILLQYLEAQPRDGTAVEILRSSFAAEISPSGLERFVEALGRRDKRDTTHLIALAGWVPDERVARLLVEMLADPDLSESAAASLAVLGDVAVGVLVENLGCEDENPSASAAAELLGIAGSKEAVDPLITQLNLGNLAPGVAARSLGMVGGEEAVGALVGLLESDSADLREAGINGLSLLRESAGAADLVKLIDNPHVEVRRAVVEVCGRLGIEESREAIVRSCSDRDQSVRAAAIRALRSVAGETGADIVVRSLKDGSPTVRAAAATALSEYRGEGTSEALAAALDDPDPWTRYFALRGLGRLKAVGCSELIRRVAQDDPAEHVRVAAGDVLNELGA